VTLRVRTTRRTRSPPTHPGPGDLQSRKDRMIVEPDTAEAPTMTQTAPYPVQLVKLVDQLRYKNGWEFRLDVIDRGQGSAGLTLDIVPLTANSYHAEKCDTCGSVITDYRVPGHSVHWSRQPRKDHMTQNEVFAVVRDELVNEMGRLAADGENMVALARRIALRVGTSRRMTPRGPSRRHAEESRLVNRAMCAVDGHAWPPGTRYGHTCLRCGAGLEQEGGSHDHRIRQH
jgi:hypothetical protein